MAHIHNAIERAGALQAAYLNALGMDEGDVERLGETLTPIIDLFREPEWAHLRTERHFANFVNTATAPAGQFAAVELVNPEGSGVLAVVRAVHQASSPDFEHGVDTGVELTSNRVTVTVRPLDTRVFGPTTFLNPRCRLSHGDVAAVFGAQAAWHADTTDEAQFPGWFVLRPGTKWIAIGSSAATDVQLNLWWSERRAFPGELP